MLCRSKDALEDKLGGVYCVESFRQVFGPRHQWRRTRRATSATRPKVCSTAQGILPTLSFLSATERRGPLGHPFVGTLPRMPPLPAFPSHPLWKMFPCPPIGPGLFFWIRCWKPCPSTKFPPVYHVNIPKRTPGLSFGQLFMLESARGYYLGRIKVKIDQRCFISPCRPSFLCVLCFFAQWMLLQWMLFLK